MTTLIALFCCFQNEYMEISSVPSYKINRITWALRDTNFIFSCCKYLLQHENKSSLSPLPMGLSGFIDVLDPHNDQFQTSQILGNVRRVTRQVYRLFCPFKPFCFLTQKLPGGYSQKNWVGVCGPLPKTLTLLMTKICDFPYPIYDVTKI